MKILCDHTVSRYDGAGPTAVKTCTLCNRQWSALDDVPRPGPAYRVVATLDTTDLVAVQEFLDG